MEPTNTSEYLVGAGKLAPPAAVTGVSMLGVSLQDWAYIVTIVYTVLMAAHLIYSWLKERKK